jgi:hypothetical protein
MPNAIYDAVDNREIRVHFVGRVAARYWNDRRGPDDLRVYTGWYYYYESNGKAASIDHGPFRSKSAAYKEAFLKEGLRRAQTKPMQVTGSNIVQMSQSAKTSGVSARADRKARNARNALRSSLRDKSNARLVGRLKRAGL